MTSIDICVPSSFSFIYSSFQNRTTTTTLNTPRSLLCALLHITIERAVDGFVGAARTRHPKVDILLTTTTGTVGTTETTMGIGMATIIMEIGMATIIMETGTIMVVGTTHITISMMKDLVPLELLSSGFYLVQVRIVQYLLLRYYCIFLNFLLHVQSSFVPNHGMLQKTKIIQTW